jgi:hypothetical protein
MILKVPCLVGKTDAVTFLTAILAWFVSSDDLRAATADFRSSQKLPMLAKSKSPVKLAQFASVAEEEDRRTPSRTQTGTRMEFPYSCISWL